MGNSGKELADESEELHQSIERERPVCERGVTKGSVGQDLCLCNFVQLLLRITHESRRASGSLLPALSQIKYLGGSLS